ncbi:hypothetical protein [Algibacter aquimarinus]|uniref:Glycerophosphoryl diester phosphodiesterase membrane domain-containing protein n=1 Tax=Algibacter aquimarinus TaxID=1136748 RepID=A0ABP9GZF1_9FLAO
MELYKSRGFSEFFQDTFLFLKLNGKHFFAAYFIINGIFLLLLAIVGYFFSKFYTEIIFGGILNGNNGGTVIDEYIDQNLGVFVIILFIFIIIALIAGVVSYAFPAIYLKLYTEKGSNNFTTKDIINTYKTNIGKLLIFVICSIIIAIPLLFVFAICGFVLMITIVGILLIPLLLGAFMLFYSMTLMEYLENKKDIWSSFGYSWKLLTSKFWAAVGSVGLFYLMSYVIQNIITIIPYMFGMASIFTNIENPNQEDIGNTMMIVMLFVFFLSFLLGAILGNIVQLNQGIVFYSLKEKNENINTKSIIDQIGSGE